MGVKLSTGLVETPLGQLRVAVTESGVVRIALPRSSGAGFAGWLRNAYPDADRVPWLPLRDKLEQELRDYFAGKRREFSLPVELVGTDFQRAVWRAIAAIPYGSTLTYAEVARAAGRKNAVRAAASATGANPLPVLVPCHRVIAAHGKLGGFSGGLDAKRRLLALEKAATAELI